MEKRMTSGEIAKKTGVSQKTVRLYDEKGLLKPSGYSEGNYRLYDKSALAVLEKIIALKQIGFSLEEIHDNLAAEKDIDITEVLTRQLKSLEARRYEIEKAIASINSVLLREAEPDWDSVAEIVKTMQTDQGADDFADYVEQNKGTLAEDTKVNLYFEDVEEESTWESIGQKGSYNCIIAHYLLEFIKDREVFLERIANALASGGMCSVNGANVSREHGFWQEIFEKLQLETEFLIEREAKSIRKREGFLAFLSGCFSKVETISLESWMRYTDAAEVFAYLLERYPEERKCLTEKEAVLKEFFTSEIKEKGAFFLPKSMDFQHCFK